MIEAGERRGRCRPRPRSDESHAPPRGPLTDEESGRRATTARGRTARTGSTTAAEMIERIARRQFRYLNPPPPPKAGSPDGAPGRGGVAGDRAGGTETAGGTSPPSAGRGVGPTREEQPASGGVQPDGHRGNPMIRPSQASTWWDPGADRSWRRDRPRQDKRGVRVHGAGARMDGRRGGRPGSLPDRPDRAGRGRAVEWTPRPPGAGARRRPGRTCSEARAGPVFRPDEVEHFGQSANHPAPSGRGGPP